jgi:4-oxalocrotonate tautomerase family enzyme
MNMQTRRISMPVITMTMGRKQITSEQKKEMIQRITEESVRITGLPQQAFTILIHELSPDAIGVAGKTLAELHGASGS